jgi:segregation and condensation protein B
MSVKAKVEALIYATEEPITLNQLSVLLKESALAELRAQEDRRLALNELISDGKSAVDDGGSAGDVEETASIATNDEESRYGYFDGKLISSEDLTQEQRVEREKDDTKRVREYISQILADLTAAYSDCNRGMEIRQIAGGYRMGTKPEHHDVVVNFAKSLKPPVRLSLQALETLAVIAYKQPVTVPEISEIRGVDSSGVIATLLDRKLITTSGRKQVIGRPILYKTTKEFLLRFGLNNVAELPSMEEFEKLGDPQAGLFPAETAESISGSDVRASGSNTDASEPTLEADTPVSTAPDTAAPVDTPVEGHEIK